MTEALRVVVRNRRCTPLQERFWSFVPATPEDECWEWLGSLDHQGYGRINRGRTGEGVARAHRVSWEIHNGPIPEGKLVIHTCRSPGCTNPRHLMLGTMATALRQAYDNGEIRRQYGKRNPRTKLSDDDVALIRALKKRGWSNLRMAQRFGVAEATVQGITSGRRRTSVIARAAYLRDAA